MRDKWMMMLKKPKKKVCLVARGVLSTPHGKIPETLLIEEMLKDMIYGSYFRSLVN